MSCYCDNVISCPHRPSIPAGASRLFGLAATFPDVRRRLLAGVDEHAALAHWRGRHGDDAGLMILEWWALISDTLHFTAEVFANEGYIGTAARDRSMRSLVDLLGHVPGPAAAAAVDLAVRVAGRTPVLVPAGTAIRSASFDGNPPQTFETTADLVADPAKSSWTIEMPPATKWSASPGDVLEVLPRSLRAVVGDPVLIRRAGATSPALRAVTAIEAVTAPDGASLQAIRLDGDTGITVGTDVADVDAETPRRWAGLWTRPLLGTDPPSVNGDRLVLDTIAQHVQQGSWVVVSDGASNRWFEVKSVAPVERRVHDPVTTDLEDAAGTVTSRISSPALNATTTEIVLDVTINDAGRRAGGPIWGSADAPSLRVGAALEPVGVLRADPSTGVTSDDVLRAAVPNRAADGDAAAGTFLVAGAVGGSRVTGRLDARSGELVLDTGQGWPGALPPPTRALGNVVEATRGETVPAETIGTGDAASANQAFVLAKSPLTYVTRADAPNGIATSLSVRVGGILWSELRSFHGCGPDEQVYTVRLDVDGVATITFGDGRNGRRLPTGAVVTATYRHGAGAATPPARAIEQMAGAVKSLTAVVNPVAAYGGADAEGPTTLRTSAPRSALLLGRAVSLADMEAAVLQMPGVVNASVVWGWHDTRQQPVVKVAYIGSSELSSTISAGLRSLVDPATPIAVDVAPAEPHSLELDIAVDDQFVSGDVHDAIVVALTTSPDGLLAPERLGIGRSLFRSKLTADALSIDGADAVIGLLVDGAPFTDAGLTPADGAWLDLIDGLSVNGRGVTTEVEA